MTIAFTICSVNYFAQAHTLGESLSKTNPNIRFFIGVVDRLDSKSIKSELLPPYQLVEVHQIGIERFEDLCGNYDITELNTAVKPYYIDYFFKTYQDAESVIYLDPDIIVYQPLTQLEEHLRQHPVVVTPHITTPYLDDKWQSEEDLVKTGIYNLGFIGVGRSEIGLKFVEWWKIKLFDGAYIDLCNGLFTDQHWIDLVPIFFDNVWIEYHLGYNVAYWNLHERFCSLKGNEWYINQDFPLIFFHYSGFNPFKSDIVSKYQNRIDFESRPDITPLFEYYRNKLLSNNQAYWQDFPCVYIKPKKIKRYVRVRKWVKKPFEMMLNLIEK